MQTQPSYNITEFFLDHNAVCVIYSFIFFLRDGSRRYTIHFKAWHILSLFSFPTESSVKPEDHFWYFVSLLSLPCRLLVRKLCKEFIPWNLSDLAYHMTDEHALPVVMTSKNWQESHSAPTPSNIDIAGLSVNPLRNHTYYDVTIIRERKTKYRIS